MDAIIFSEVKKSFYSPSSKTSVCALSDFSLSVKKGEIYALVGPNGAGKTTAIKILAGLAFQDSGRAYFFDSPNIITDKSKIGFAPENPALPEHLTIIELLHYSNELLNYNCTESEIDELLLSLNLQSQKNSIIKNLSKGTKQRISLAVSILHRPQYLILDEPTSGLDPIGRNITKQLLKKINQNGTTILFTTHILSDLPDLCTNFGIISSGKLLFEGDAKDFCTHQKANMIEEKFISLMQNNK